MQAMVFEKIIAFLDVSRTLPRKGDALFGPKCLKYAVVSAPLLAAEAGGWGSVHIIFLRTSRGPPPGASPKSPMTFPQYGMGR